MAGSTQHATFHGDQGIDVARSYEVRGLGILIGHSTDRLGAFSSGDTCFATCVIHWCHERRRQRGCIQIYERSQVQTLADGWQHGRAQLPMPLKHEIDRLGSNSLRSANKVPFVLTVFVIQNDDDQTSRYCKDCFFNGTKFAGHHWIIVLERWDRSERTEF
jgi:hypothetical protein